MNTRKGFRAPSNQPSQAEINRLINLFNDGKAAALEPEARAFVRKHPNHLFGHKALAASLTMQKKHGEALVVLAEGIRRFANDSELHTNLAAALIHAGRYEEAIASADEAIRCQPKNAGAYANKGLALKQIGSWRIALETYHKAIELNPNDHLSLNNAGVALLELELPEQAVECFKAALAIQAGHHEYAFNLARAHEDLKFLKNAQGEFDALLNAQPEHDRARASLIHLLRKNCEFSAAAAHEAILRGRLRDGKVTGEVAAFPVLSMAGFNRADQRAVGYQNAVSAFGHLMATNVQAATPKAPGAGLRIGYLSADFHHHATAMLMIGMLEAHDKQRFEIHAYSHGRNDGSPMRTRLEKACTAFHDIRALSYTEAARKIAEDGIDILIDLKGYTKDARIDICALRPAPIIVSWLGYPGTLGHPRLADYLIGDPVVTPIEHQPDYSETLALMPHCYQPNDRLRPVGPAPSRASCGLPEQGFVFCSFNQSYKITAEVFSNWCRMLAAIPGSILWLLRESEEATNNLRMAAVEQGIDPDRLVFAQNIAIADHLGRLQHAGLALDTFPYGSHTTGSDALWAGVPLIAIRGETFASRVSSSLLTNTGLQELITDSPSAAADLAIRLANDPERLGGLRRQLLESRLSVPLFDAERFSRDIEHLYTRIWEQHLKGIREPIALAP
jgi:protein O-GlcNAc transferase